MTTRAELIARGEALLVASFLNYGSSWDSQAPIREAALRLKADEAKLNRAEAAAVAKAGK